MNHARYRYGIKKTLSNIFHEEDDSSGSTEISESHFWAALDKAIKRNKKSANTIRRICKAKRLLRPVVDEIIDDAYNVIYEAKYKREEISLSRKSYKKAFWASRLLSELDDEEDGPFSSVYSMMRNSRVKMDDPGKIIMERELVSQLYDLHEQLGAILENLIEIPKGILKERGEPVLFQNGENVSCSVNPYTVSRAEESDVEYIYREGTECYCKTKKEEKDVSMSNKTSFADDLISLDEQIEKEHTYEQDDYYDEPDEFTMNEQKAKTLMERCLDDLEKIKSYFNKSGGSGECSCGVTGCHEVKPHLHTMLDGSPILLKLQRSREDFTSKNNITICVRPGGLSDPNIELAFKTCKNPHCDSRQFKNKKTNKREKPKITCSDKSFGVNLLQIYQYKRHIKNIENSPNENLENNLIVFNPQDPPTSYIKMTEKFTQEESSQSKETNSSTQKAKVLTREANTTMFETMKPTKKDAMISTCDDFASWEKLYVPYDKEYLEEDMMKHSLSSLIDNLDKKRLEIPSKPYNLKDIRGKSILRHRGDEKIQFGGVTDSHVKFNKSLFPDEMPAFTEAQAFTEVRDTKDVSPLKEDANCRSSFKKDEKLERCSKHNFTTMENCFNFQDYAKKQTKALNVDRIDQIHFMEHSNGQHRRLIQRQLQHIRLNNLFRRYNPIGKKDEFSSCPSNLLNTNEHNDIVRYKRPKKKRKLRIPKDLTIKCFNNKIYYIVNQSKSHFLNKEHRDVLPSYLKRILTNRPKPLLGCRTK